MNRQLLCCLLLAVVAAACSGSSDEAVGITAPDGFEVAVWATGFDGPTQMVLADNGDLIIAELNGTENDATGRILRVAADDHDSRVVLQDGLNKPTGIAITGDRLWIMEQRRLVVTTLDPGDDLEVVADELAFNGRSEGTLTRTDDDRLLYDTSGSKRGPDRVDGSGTLFAIEHASAGPSEPVVIATGFKHAYAHLVDPDGQLWSIEMTDGNFDGTRASDELVSVDVGDDAGWPQCVEDNRPVVEYGGTTELCATAPGSHALFGFGAAPTSIVLAPWDDEVFVVTLWLSSQVVTVPRTPPVGGPHEPALFLEGIESPQHLLVVGDLLLVSDHDTGQIFAVSH